MDNGIERDQYILMNLFKNLQRTKICYDLVKDSNNPEELSTKIESIQLAIKIIKDIRNYQNSINIRFIGGIQ